MTREEGWLPFSRQFFRFSYDIEKLFDEIIHRPWGGEPRGWRPAIDLYETPEALVLMIDLPGLKKEQLRVEVEGNDLLLRGERFAEQRRRVGKVHYQERYAGRFERRILLPTYVDKEHLRVRFKGGVCHVILPKIREDRS